MEFYFEKKKLIQKLKDCGEKSNNAFSLMPCFPFKHQCIYDKINEHFRNAFNKQWLRVEGYVGNMSVAKNDKIR